MHVLQPQLALLAILMLFAGCVSVVSPHDSEPKTDGKEVSGENDRGFGHEPIMPAGFRQAEPNLTYLDRDPLHGPTSVDHNHLNPTQHVDGHNLEILSVVGGSATAYGLIDHSLGYIFQCTGNGFRIIDVSRPGVGREVGEATTTFCFDIKVTSDGELALVSGKEIVDVRQKDSPETLVADTGASCHMCHLHTIGGKEYAFLAQDRAHAAGVGRGIGIYELQRDPVRLVYVSTYEAPLEKRVATHFPDADPNNHVVHDMYVYDDPVLGRPIMVAAYWDLGVRMVDLSDPAKPQEIASWADFQGDDGNIHTVAVEFIGNRRIIAASTENLIYLGPVNGALGRSLGFLYLLDATDPSQIRLLGKWSNPGKHPSGVFGNYSPHDFQLLAGRAYISHRHAGVWVVDVAGFVKSSQPDAARSLLRDDPVPTWGFSFTPTNRTTTDAVDVVVQDGLLYVSDYNSGLHIIRFLGDASPDPRMFSNG